MRTNSVCLFVFLLTYTPYVYFCYQLQPDALEWIFLGLIVRTNDALEPIVH